MYADDTAFWVSLLSQSMVGLDEELLTQTGEFVGQWMQHSKFRVKVYHHGIVDCGRSKAAWCRGTRAGPEIRLWTIWGYWLTSFQRHIKDMDNTCRAADLDGGSHFYKRGPVSVFQLLKDHTSQLSQEYVIKGVARDALTDCQHLGKSWDPPREAGECC